MTKLFCPSAKRAAIEQLVHHPVRLGARITNIKPCHAAQLEDEDALLQQLRLRTGPHAATPRLQHHLRASRGRVCWACTLRCHTLWWYALHLLRPGNGYLREAVAEELLPDFAARPAAPFSAQPEQPVAPAAAPDGVQLAALPQGVLEDILGKCTLRTLCAAAATCSTMHKV